MTFPLANLIHKRHHISRSRIVPCVSIAAVAIAAALLLLASTGTTRAEAPGTSAAPQPATCDGLSSLTLVASPAGATSGTSAAPDANCNFEVTLGALPTQPPSDALADLQPCAVTTTPVSASSNGIELATATNGNCNGVSVSIEIRLTGPSSGELADVASTTVQSVTARLKAEDWPNATMFHQWATVVWAYSEGLITSTTTNADTWDNLWWGLDWETTGVLADPSDESYSRWHSAKWHSNGFPIPYLTPAVGAKTKVQASAGAAGVYYCTFTHTWLYGQGWYPDLQFRTTCESF